MGFDEKHPFSKMFSYQTEQVETCKVHTKGDRVQNSSYI
jgi:hypothetical protein